MKIEARRDIGALSSKKRMPPLKKNQEVYNSNAGRIPKKLVFSSSSEFENHNSAVQSGKKTRPTDNSDDSDPDSDEDEDDIMFLKSLSLPQKITSFESKIAAVSTLRPSVNADSQRNDAAYGRQPLV